MQDSTAIPKLYNVFALVYTAGKAKVVLALSQKYVKAQQYKHEYKFGKTENTLMALDIKYLKALLGKHENYLTQNGEINTPLLYRYAQECNTDLLTLLSTDDDARNEFFIRHGEHIIFVRDRFIDYIHHKDFLANSYTAYKNKVGLAGLARYGDLSLLKSMHEVVLSFPFKDCILEGGQNKDEAKRNERYYNRVLAADEIDRLLDPKVLTNAQRYTKKERQPLTEFTRDANINEQRGSSADTITDNLIIKGNNLLALHTLREQFAHKVKLIYIDPPYNTGNDSFHYNDSFNHSTWLVFMKNRLEAARELLRQDGVIFVQCDDNEQAYLKVLMDEIFGRENFRNTILTRRLDKNLNTQFIDKSLKSFNTGCDYILTYAKSESFNFFPVYREASEKRKDKGYWKGFWNSADRPTMRYSIFNINIDEGQWKWEINKAKEAIKNYQNYLNDYSNKMSLEEYYYATGETKKFIRKNPSGKSSGKNKGVEHWIPPSKGILRSSNWSDIITTELNHNIDFSSPKSENLISEIITCATKPGDIVLDYHLGSGTTAAVAHKMGRQYIGIEQMDYIESVSVARLQKVIEGEQGGISKAAKWEGGGNFVYFELKAHNQTFISRIASATTTKELLAIKEDILAKADLDYRLDTEMVNQSPKEFSALSQEYQKQILLDFLEINQLYVPYTERDDNTRFACTNEEKRISEMFYGEE